MTSFEPASLAWDKMDGLIPAIVQDDRSGRVLMLGYMDAKALDATMRTGLVTFHSRSKERLWQKGETSGNSFNLVDIGADCDGDALLVLARPNGPACHLGTASCFGDDGLPGPGWLAELSSIIAERARSRDEASYTRALLEEGLERIAQKIGEEGVELALAAVSRTPGACAEETADLLYHLSVLMEAKGFSWSDAIAILKERHATRTKEQRS